MPDGQPRSRSPLDEPREDRPSLVKIVASEQHFFDVQSVLAPFLDLVEIALVRVERVVGFLMGPIVSHCGRQKLGFAQNGAPWPILAACDRALCVASRFLMSVKPFDHE